MKAKLKLDGPQLVSFVKAAWLEIDARGGWKDEDKRKELVKLVAQEVDKAIKLPGILEMFDGPVIELLVEALVAAILEGMKKVEKPAKAKKEE